MSSLNQYSSLLNDILPIFHTSAKVILKYQSKAFDGFPKQPYLSICSVTVLLTVSATLGLFSGLKALTSPHLQVLVLAVPSTWNALSYKTVSSLVPERISLTTLRCPLLVSTRVPACYPHITFLNLSFAYQFYLTPLYWNLSNSKTPSVSHPPVLPEPSTEASRWYVLKDYLLNQSAKY